MKRRERGRKAEKDAKKADSRTNLRLDIPYSLQWVKTLRNLHHSQNPSFYLVDESPGSQTLCPPHIMPEWHFLNAYAILDGALYFAYFLFCKTQEGG